MTRDEFVPAGDLEHGEQVVTIDGQLWHLTTITPRAGPETVYNFEVAGEHVYYVGRDGLLVHNVYVVDAIKGVTHHARSYQAALIKAGRRIPNALGNAKRLHGHHIVMKGLFRGWLNGSRKYVKYSQQVLKKAGIDIHDLWNLAHAKNEAHSLAYAMAVQKRLQNAVELAKAGKGNLTDNVTKALKNMQDILEDGKRFW